MRQVGVSLLLGLMVWLVVIGCDRSSMDELSWSTTDSEYEGYPLRVDKPNYTDIYEYKARYPRLVRITFHFDSTMANGWPKPDYEIALADFDEDMRVLFDREKEGIIFLIETYGAQRAYHYFISDMVDYKARVVEIGYKYPKVTLVPSTKMNSNWEFLNEYPTKLY
jgi:hypothetical protein